jgi:DNA-directed RNA polymerase I and III subunit RPAC1
MSSRGTEARLSSYRLESDAMHEQFEAYNKGKVVAAGGFAALFVQNLSLRVTSCDEETIAFDLIGVDAALANALRRILLAEVPTIAIETVYVEENTSIIHDEVLAHRLGLLPILADANDFDAMRAPDDELTDANTLVFNMEVSVNPTPGATSGRRSPTGGATSAAAAARAKAAVVGAAAARAGAIAPTTPVYSSALQWAPQGNQAERFAGDAAPRPVHDDVLLAKAQ